MSTAQALLYLIGVVFLFVAAFRVAAPVSFALLGAGCLALGYTLPAIAGGLH